MKIPDKVENCPVCEPIKSLLFTLVNKGFVVLEQKCTDYHFHELFFHLKSNDQKESIEIVNDKIKKHENGFYYCECHWSKVIAESNLKTY